MEQLFYLQVHNFSARPKQNQFVLQLAYNIPLPMLICAEHKVGPLTMRIFLSAALWANYFSTSEVRTNFIHKKRLFLQLNGKSFGFQHDL